MTRGGWSIYDDDLSDLLGDETSQRAPLAAVAPTADTPHGLDGQEPAPEHRAADAEGRPAAVTVIEFAAEHYDLLYDGAGRLYAVPRRGPRIAQPAGPGSGFRAGCASGCTATPGAPSPATPSRPRWRSLAALAIVSGDVGRVPRVPQHFNR